jgi:hypothetical protein
MFYESNPWIIEPIMAFFAHEVVMERHGGRQLKMPMAYAAMLRGFSAPLLRFRMANQYVRAERISLRMHPELTEKWVQERIAADPSILGLGDLVLRDKERIQPRAGRLDLLLQDPETLRRYEVELQLGATDEAHIIRTIEYWQIESKRYPQYEHCAVLIAEDITSRFLNV